MDRDRDLEVRTHCGSCPVSKWADRQEGELIIGNGASAKREVKKAIHRTKRGTQRSGRSHKAKSRKQAIAIGLSKARKKGGKVPKKKS